MKIGTHNSGTGERPLDLLSYIGIPFARCQSKTITQQYRAGARYFDLRVKWYCGEFHIAHGLWLSLRTLTGILDEISDFPETCHVILTYEGKDSDKEYLHFMRSALLLPGRYPKIEWEYFAIKKPKWRIIRMDGKNYPEQGFIPLTGWRCLLPFPWLWAQFCRRNRDTNKWVLVDFL